MDGSRFDAWTRRRFGLAAGGMAALLGLAASLPGPAGAKNNNKPKKCKGGKKTCGKKCIAKSKCCGGCGGQTCCKGTCVDLATDGANCGACNNGCVTGDCIHGACRCGNGMPVCGAGCSCGARAEGGEPACFSAPFFGVCDEDADCPVGSVCLGNNTCSSPCLG